MKISIVIPAYNEEKRILDSLNKIELYFKQYSFDYEVIIIDDGSKDNTVQLVQSFIQKNKKFKLLINPKNTGKGYSVKRGMLISEGDLVLFTDADLHAPLSELNKFLPFIKEYDVVIASRLLPASLVGEVAHRKFIGQIFSWLVHILVIKDLPDTQCGFKLFTKRAAQKIFSNQLLNGWCFDVESLFLAQKFGFKIKETPIISNNAPGSTVNPITAGTAMFFDLFKIRFNDFIGRYK